MHCSGIGFDVHRFAPVGAGRPLVLGGVRIPRARGLQGHSDADVLSHALCDALLGAASAGDIGQHFPDTDRRWRNASSLVFLRHAASLARRRGFRIVHVDAVLVTEAPRLAPYRARIRARLARALAIPVSAVSVKGKSAEGLGFVGRREGMAAWAIANLAR